MEKTRKRIISLDVIRAFALLGILLVHLCQYYGFNNEYNSIPQSDFYCVFNKVVTFLLDSKMRNMLSLLFGITFFFLMNKPDYGVAKFCKRCLVLMAFGLVNILFYTTDILLWFGLSGLIVCLSCVWKMNAKWMLVVGVSLILLGPYFNGFFRETLFPGTDIALRYLSSSTVIDIITYPFSDILKGFIRTFAGTATIGYIILGYSIAKIGIATSIDVIANKRNVFLCLVAYLISYFLLKITEAPVFMGLWHLIGVVLYMILIVMLSHKIRILSELMSKYGKMTLTHYSCQEIIMPCVVAAFIIPYHLGLPFLLLIGLLFFVIQLFFSVLWFEKHQYGPMEFVWRKLSS